MNNQSFPPMNNQSFPPMNLSNHPVIPPNYSATVNTNDTQYPPGTVNPIKIKTITKSLNIDSYFRTNYDTTTSTNFMWNLIQPETNVVSIRLSSIDIPVLWYSITDKMERNVFDISLYDMNGYPNIKHSIVIPAGNYTSDTFTNMLNIIFKKQGNGLEYLISDVDSTSSKTIIRAMDRDDILSDPTGLSSHAAFDITNTHYAPKFHFALDFFPSANKYSSKNKIQEFKRTIGWYMGFRKYKYNVNQNNLIQHLAFDPLHNSLFYECGIESDSSYSNTHENYIFLSVNDYNTNCVCQSIMSSNGLNYIGDNLLARITVNVNKNEILYDNGYDLTLKKREYMGPVTIDKLNIILINRYGEPIDLNMNDFSFTLELTKIYQHNLLS
jgi:hypothetical protein